MTVLLVNNVIGQEEEKTKTGFWELKTGVGIGRLQNLKSSQVRLSGAVVPISIYRGKLLENARYGGGIALSFGTLTSPFNEVTDVSSSELKFHFNYLKNMNVQNNLFDTWYLGGELEWRNQSLINELAGNNRQNAIFSNSLSVVSHFERSIRLLNKDVKLSYDLTLGLLSYAKDDGSFAFAVAQTALENGEFNTQDFESGRYEHGEIVSLNKFTNIKSKVAIHLPAKKRSSWVIAYEWSLVKYSRIKNYGVTNAAHTISISRFIPKKKK